MITYIAPGSDPSRGACVLFGSQNAIAVDFETYLKFCDVDPARRDIFIDAVIKDHEEKERKVWRAGSKVEPSLIPPYALTQIAEVLTKGKQKHPDEKWKVLSIKDHVDATLRHMLAYLRGEWNEEEQCNHLVNAACRLLFAIEKLPKDKSE